MLRRHDDFEDYYRAYVADWQGRRLLLAEARSPQAFALVLVLRFPVEVRRWIREGVHERAYWRIGRWETEEVGRFTLEDLGVT
jgi:hypothetical protein